tara:strand:- start:85 stop:555 length:471 start_codon:yes stop_codon:yes gene_type:complete
MSNVAYAIKEEDIDIDRVWESIKSAQIEDLINKMPQGLSTQVGDNGIRLSGGQRQRIAIARALYRKTRFLVLDEATSALDNKTEANVITSLDSIMSKYKFTTILIAHRLSTVKKCDKIYEFEAGKIKHFGSYEELINKSSSFREISNLRDPGFGLI